ncbi:PREDICTED: E3 ubiquitin-protein ligase TRIM39-like, partial [Leptosomus discolor]
NERRVSVRCYVAVAACCTESHVFHVSHAETASRSAPFLRSSPLLCADTLEPEVSLTRERAERAPSRAGFEWRGFAQTTLAPNMANTRLYLSEDRGVLWRRSPEQDLPSNLGRFKVRPYVLGLMGFTSCWPCRELELCGEGTRAIEVAREVWQLGRRAPAPIPCGHNFCRACITRCWEGLEERFSCPQCRQTASQRSFRPSRELANIADIARQLSGRAAGGAAGREGLCRQHQEALKLFCKEDREPICVVCDRSQAHRFHAVVPVEEAAQEYKEEIQARLQALKEEREKYLESSKTGVRKSSYLEKTRNEAKKIACEFEQLHQFLKDQERLLLIQLIDLEQAITRAQKEAVVKVLEEMSHLDTLIWEMEGKFQQPASQFLQDIRRLLNSCEVMKFSPPVEISSELERGLEDFVQRNALVRGTLRRCQDSLMFALQEPTDVTLDPATAHPNLHLSEDRKQARGQLTRQNLPDNPERFDFEPCVLGCEGFTSGRHFWEVEVGQGGVWALGVARASVKRKGPMSLTRKEGVWALEAYHSLTSPRANLRPNQLPRRIRVSLDYEGRRVAFFSADDDAPILVYTGALFNGERVFPWFKIGMGAHLQEISQTPLSEDQPMTGQLMSPLDWVGFRFPLRICP